MSGAARNTDKRLLLWLGAGALLLAVIVGVAAPKEAEDDPTPSTYNSGTAGAKAAYLMLSELGYNVQRWSANEDELAGVDAAHTTLILAEPRLPGKSVKASAAAVKAFVERGGRVLATGSATLLPSGLLRSPSLRPGNLCYTTPQGDSALAKAGKVSIGDTFAWDEPGSKLGDALHVDQRCGKDAMVVSYAFGKGRVIWWSAATPLSNAGLKDDASLRLLLASIGPPGQTVLFDEFVHGGQSGFWDAAKGLPLKWLVGQFVLIAVLMVLSFSRRRGPLRMPVTVPRTSPVEFAESMGHLYQRAGATSAPIGMARRRLLRFLHAEAGLAHATIDAGPQAMEEALRERFSGDWSALRQHLTDAGTAERAQVAAGSALRLVQALDDDLQRLQQLLAPKTAAAVRAAADEMETEDAVELVSAAKE